MPLLQWYNIQYLTKNRLMFHIGFIIVLLIVVLLVSVYLYKRNNVSPEQKLLNDFAKIEKEFEKRMKKREKNMQKIDENMEKIRMILKDNDEKLRKIRDVINGRMQK